MSVIAGTYTLPSLTSTVSLAPLFSPPSAPLQVAADGGGGGYSQHMRNLDWEFAVVDQPDVNAFVVPGGKVVVYTGRWGRGPEGGRGGG